MKFYFVSDKNFDGEVLYPKLIETTSMKEDCEPERICVSPSIKGCCEAIVDSIEELFYNTLINKEYKPVLYVHICESEHFIQPSIEQVFDSDLTGEFWIIQPTKMKLYTTLIVKKEWINHNQPLRYYLYDNNRSFYINPKYFNIDNLLYNKN